MTDIAFAIVVTDGVSLRTIHPAALGPAAKDVECILRAHLLDEPPMPPFSTGTSTLTQREIAQAQGYTGDVCSTCGGFTMKRAGTCLTCQACGDTTGCG